MELEKMLNTVIEELNEAHEAGTLSDYIADALEVEYTKNLSGHYIGAKLLVTFGNPNVYVNTRTGKIEGYLDRDHLQKNIPGAVWAELDDIIMEIVGTF